MEKNENWWLLPKCYCKWIIIMEEFFKWILCNERSEKQRKIDMKHKANFGIDANLNLSIWICKHFLKTILQEKI